MRPIIAGFFRTVLLIALFLLGASLVGSLGLFGIACSKVFIAFRAMTLFNGQFVLFGALITVFAAWALIIAVWANFVRMLRAFRDERGVGNKIIAPLWYVIVRTGFSFAAVFPWYLSVNHTLSTRGIYTFIAIGLIAVVMSFKEGLPHE